MKKSTALLLLAIFSGIIFCLWLWLADKDTDVPAPTMSSIVFDPRFGPKTPREAREYVENRVRGRWKIHYSKSLTAGDLESEAGKVLWANEEETLRRRWGINLSMNQRQIDAVREEARLAWAYVEQSRTLRHKIRVFLGWAE